MESRHWPQGLASSTSQLIFWDKSLWLNPSSMTWHQWTPRTCLLSPPQHHSPSTSIRNAQEYVYPDVYVSAGDPNSGPRACVSPECSSMWPAAHRSYTLQMTSERDILMGKDLQLKLGIGRKKWRIFDRDWRGIGNKGIVPWENCPQPGQGHGVPHVLCAVHSQPLWGDTGRALGTFSPTLSSWIPN